MSLKDLFKQGKSKILVAKSTEEIGQEAESERYVYERSQDQKRVIPQIDFSQPKNFAKFGSAEEYYAQSIARIYNTYPYDGSRYEKQAWENSSSYLDLYVLEELYPRTNGYAVFSPDDEGNGWGNKAATVGAYDKSSDLEYIFLKGGPNPNNDSGEIQKAFPNLETRRSGNVGANIYDLAKNRESNLKLDAADGNTVEFWLKKPNFLSDINGGGYEVLFDCYTTSSLSSSLDYGRLRVELTGNTSGSPFRITFMSGTNGLFRETIGDVTTSSVGDDNWHHYAFVLKNTGSLGPVSALNKPPVTQNNRKDIQIDFYVDGKLNSSVITGSTIDYVSGALVATVGALAASPSGTAGGTIQTAVGTDMQAMRGYGKLSGSVDEFRFWKEARTAKQVGLNWKSALGAGTNLDDANTQLGVYYKFNEGITQTASVDSNVLDYAGRVTNGNWVGYEAAGRSTNSAIVESSASAEEFKDPIVYSFHPDVKSLKETKELEGRVYDYNNPGGFYRTFPDWMLAEDNETEKGLLRLTQIMSSYFDSLYLQLKQLPRIKDVQYVSSSIGATGSYKPLPFADRVLESKGFMTSEIFADSTIVEQFLDKDDNKLFTEKLSDVKNLIYQNIHNNLVEIYKTKGTENAFRNFIRCFGVDDELIQLNAYTNNEVFEIRDNYRYRSERKNYVDFHTYGDHDANVYQFKSGSNSAGFISASQAQFFEKGMAQTYECEFIAPPPWPAASTGSLYYNSISSSVFGVQQVNYKSDGTVDETDTSFELTAADDFANFQVFLARDEVGSNSAKFVLTSSNASGIQELTSSFFRDLYDNRKWNLAVRIVPKASPWENTVHGTSDENGYEVQFYGVNYDANTVRDSFYLTGTLIGGDARGDGFLKNGKRMYIGALRTNFTGSLVSGSDLKISSTRAWMANISNEEINAHAIDASNMGSLHPYRSAYLFENSSSVAPIAKVKQGNNQYVPSLATLALNWDYKTLTGSSAGGTFSVVDFSSGSAEDFDRYRWLGNVLKMQHPGRGGNFRTNQTNVVDTNYVNSAKQQDPETVVGLDMIKSLSRDDVQFTRESRPISYFFMLEKSMYKAVTEQMLNFFATVKDFNDLIGSPVNRYRQDYKAMEKLRNLFFERVDNTPDLDKYIEYYRWLDTSIGEMAEQLYPASAAHAKGLKTVVESHVLERNKYRHQYPSVEQARDYDKLLSTEEQMQSERDTYLQDASGEYGTQMQPKTASPLDTNTSFNWWALRAERDKADEISSGDSTVDKNREQLRKVIANHKTLALGAAFYRRGTKQSLNDVFNAPNKKGTTLVKVSHDFAGGTNSIRGANTGLIEPNLNIEGNSVPTLRSDQKPDTQDPITNAEEINDIRFPKIKMEPKINVLDESYGARRQTRNTQGLPSLYSSSAGLEFTNVQQKVSHGAEVPMQGPFVERVVGGFADRTVPISSGSQDETTRVERFRLSGEASALNSGTDVNIHPPRKTAAGTENLNLPRTDINKGIKSVYNLSNVLQATASGQQKTTIIGNFDDNYQIVQTSGRSENNLWFSKNSGSVNSTTPEVPFLTGNLDYEIPERTIHKSVIVERFSAPGGFEVNSVGYMDPQAEEKSVYNALPFRNRSVLDGSGSLSGLTPPTDRNDRTHIDVYTRIHPAWGSGLNELSRKHTGKFGIDSNFGEIVANDYDTTGSYHKQHRNTKRIIKLGNAANDVLGVYNGARHITASVYNNLFYNSLLPQSELQYAWISASLDNAPNHPLVGYTSTQKGYSGQVSGANGYEDPIKFLDGESPQYSGYSSDLVGLNTLVLNELVTGSNLISASTDYRNVELATVTSGEQFHVLLKHRNSNQGAGWRLNIKESNPLVRSQRENNIIDIVDLSEVAKSSKDAGSDYEKSKNTKKIRKTVNKFTVPPVSSKFKPLVHVLSDSVGDVMSIKDSYSSNFNFMPITELDFKLGVRQTEKQVHDVIVEDALNDGVSMERVTYSETVHPREENTYLSKVRGRLTLTEESGSADINRRLGTARTFWKTAPGDRRRTSTHEALNSMDYLLSQEAGSGSFDGSGNSYNHLRAFSPSLSIWPLDAGYLSNSFGESFNNYWFDPSGGSTKSQEPPQGHFYQQPNGELLTPVIYQLIESVDAKAFTPTDANFQWRGPGTASQQFLFPNDWTLNLSESDGTIGSNRNYDVKFLTYNFYRINDQSGNRPFFNTYVDFAKDIRSFAKDHTVLPEFRISEHMDYYVDEGFSFNNRFLSLEGTSISASADTEKGEYTEEFFKLYSHSDFMQQFAKFDSNDNDISKMSLTCHGVKKLLPYNGFYPVLRTTQLGSLFSQSFGPFISGSAAAQTGSFEPERMNSLLQPFFAPGIMYNTIKSGIAVDFPVVTGTLPAGAGLRGYFRRAGATQGQFYNYRMPFEALVEPQRYIPVNHSGSESEEANISFLYNWTGSSGVNPPIFPNPVFANWSGKSKLNFNLAMNNFLAEVPNFFLRNQSFTSFTSAPEKKFKTMKSGSTYYMDIELFQTDEMVMAQGLSEVPLQEVTSSASSLKGLVNNNYRGQIFGPAVQYFATGDNIAHPNYAAGQGAYYSETRNMADPAFAPHTPPYFYGPAIARVAFTPNDHIELLEDESRFFTLDEILAGCRIETVYTSSYTEETNWLHHARTNKYPAGLSQMRITSSVNLFGKSSVKKVQYEASAEQAGKFIPATATDPDDSSFDVWTISPKFECPVVNVSGSTVSSSANPYSTLKEASLGYQTGNSDDWANKKSNFGFVHSVKSVWGQLGEVPSGSEGIFLRLKESYPDIIENPASGDQLTGSLIDICGFEEAQKRVGEIADQKVISEAVVAIPFVQKGGKRKFFELLRSQIDFAQGKANKKQITSLEKTGKTPGNSIINMVDSLENYVLPPHMDFINNKSITPYAVYVFEFTHVLDKQDLSNIWQNLMPEISKKAEQQEVTVSHSLGTNEFFSGKEIPAETQWMVFKVKKRAAYNYFAATADSTDDDRFAFQFEFGGEKKTPDYSYNWPYDYFSLVELAKIDAEVEFTKKKPEG